MGRRFVFHMSVLALAMAVMPGIAYASGELLRPVDGPVLMRFGAIYSGPGGQATHHGLDLSAETGDDVRAPAGGVVSFAGEVPAAGGGRTIAVTVTTDDGMQVTVMPIERSLVHRGDEVVAGVRLGVLAGSGDASGAQPHVHLSVRQAGAYRDPEPMLLTQVCETLPAPTGGTTTSDGHMTTVHTGAAVALPDGVGGAASSAVGQTTANVGYVTAATAAPPLLSSAQSEVLHDAFSAEIDRLRSGHGRIRSTGFTEPTLADKVGTAVTGQRMPLPPRAAAVGAGILVAVAGAGFCARRVPVVVRAISRIA